MKFSERWLREWVSPELDTQGLAHQLTMAGLEVDTVEPAAPALDRVVVGHIVAIEPHPDAERLRVCSVVADDTEAPLQIVCGAPNARVGLRAPVALTGARLPDGSEIRRARLRGVESSGMLCSARELGLSDDAAGLMELPADAPAGVTLQGYLDLDDSLITVELTPNRGDCLSIAGVAREVAALNRLTLAAPARSPVEPTVRDLRPIHIEATEACPRYAGQVITGLDGTASTPLWMRERLRRSGLRSRGPLVDVTNYVMLELGQPLHAFDQARLCGGIVVRYARPGERLTLLNHTEVALETDCLVIADESGPVAFAGIMGGLATAVDDDTTQVFLESANFTPQVVAGRGRRYKLTSDALYRFERGVDPELPLRALERAASLLLEICGGSAGPVVESDVRGQREHAPITLRHTRITRLLGTEVAADEVADILARLNMAVQPEGHGEWRVRPPSFRYDVALEADLIEEVARIHGYDRLPLRERRAESRFRPVPEGRISVDRVRETLVQRDYQEAITYSFVDPDVQVQLQPDDVAAIDVDNPIARQYAQMRTSLWSSLLPAWQHNAQRRQERIRLFEMGRRYWRDGQTLKQDVMIAGVASGPVLPEQWAGPARTVDFFDLKGDVEALLTLGGSMDRVEFVADRHPALHPGQSARIASSRGTLGWLGRLHPRLSAQFDTRDLPLVFELSLDAVCAAAVPAYVKVAEFPSIRRDLALVVDESLTVGEITRCLREMGGPLLRQVRLFDIYRGESLQPGSKSVALGLIYQDNSRTLTDEEVDAVVHDLRHHLEHTLGAVIRG